MSKESQGFLKMHEYGPYDLQRREGLEDFLCGVVILMENKRRLLTSTVFLHLILSNWAFPLKLAPHEV